MDTRRFAYAILYFILFYAFSMLGLYTLVGYVSTGIGFLILPLLLGMIAITINSQQGRREYQFSIENCERNRFGMAFKKKVRRGQTDRLVLMWNKIVMVGSEYMIRHCDLVLELHNRDRIRIVGKKRREGIQETEALFDIIVNSLAETSGLPAKKLKSSSSHRQAKSSQQDHVSHP